MEMAECRFCNGVVRADAQKCKHCGEWLKPTESVSGLSPAVRRDDDRVVCQHCQKTMVPRIVMGPGFMGATAPRESVCPFCAGSHKKFPVRLSTSQKVSVAVFFVFALVVLTMMAGALGRS